MSRASQAKLRPAAPLPGGPDPDSASPIPGQLAAIERAFAAQQEADASRPPIPEEFAPRETPAAKIPVEAFIIGLFVAISYVNAALLLFR